MGNTQTVLVGAHTLRFRSQLAGGGQGTVYLVEDEARKKYAVKVSRAPKSEPELNHSHEFEIEQHALVPPHPNIVRYLASKVDRTTDPVYNVYYLLMEYCPRTVLGMLEQAAKRKEPLPERDILQIFTSAVAAVRHLHSCSIAHRDVKVENLLIGAADGATKLCDLGSCSVDHRVLRNSTEIGYAKEDIERHTTLAYRAPEQVDLYSGKRVGEPVDVWALGVLLFKLCYLRTPFEDKTGSVSAMAILNVSYKLPPPAATPHNFPAGIATLIKLMLDPDPDSRPTAAQVLLRVRDLMSTGELTTFSDLPGVAAADITPPLSPIPIRALPSREDGGLSAGDHGAAESFVDEGRMCDVLRPSSIATSRGIDGSLSPSAYSPHAGTASAMGGSRSLGPAVRFGPDVWGNGPEDEEDAPRPYVGERQGGTPDLSDLATVNRGATPGGTVRHTTHRRESSAASQYDEYGRPKNPRKTLGELFQKRMLKMMGEGKRAWVGKATSKEPGIPKAKYVRKIILAVWEQEMSSSTFFIYLYQRPMHHNPVVAVKGLITTLKLLQQGPHHFLAECVPCMVLMDEMGKQWASVGAKMASQPGQEHLPKQALAEGYTTASPTVNGGAPSQSPRHCRQTLDESSVSAIGRLAHVLVLKLHFHDQHPEFATHFTNPSSLLGYESVPITGRVEDVNALSRLLTIEEAIVQTQRLIFSARNEAVVSTLKWALLPLIEEAYAVFVATTFILASLLELSARSTPAAMQTSGSGLLLMEHKAEPQSDDPARVNWRQHITALLNLREQYEAQLVALQDFFRSAGNVPEVRAMRRVPQLPASMPVALDGSLNWKPQTMRSPLRVSALADRARVDDDTRDASPFGGDRSDATLSPTEASTSTLNQTTTDASDWSADCSRGRTGADNATPQAHVELRKDWESFGDAGFVHQDHDDHMAWANDRSTTTPAPPVAQSMPWFLPSTVADKGQNNPPEYPCGVPPGVLSPACAPRDRVMSRSPSLLGLEEFLQSASPMPVSQHVHVNGAEDQLPCGMQQQAFDGQPLLPTPIVPLSSWAGAGQAREEQQLHEQASPVVLPGQRPSSLVQQQQPMQQPYGPTRLQMSQAATQQYGLESLGGMHSVASCTSHGNDRLIAIDEFLEGPGSGIGVEESGVEEGADELLQGPAKDESIDLLAWTSDEDDDGDDDMQGEGVVSLTTANFSCAMGMRGDPPSPPEPVAPPQPPPALSTTESQREEREREREARARKREAKAQPWRQNMKGPVRLALDDCIAAFGDSGTLLCVDEIVFGGSIGHGAFATVYKGYYRGVDVAVKKLVTQNGLPMVEKSIRDFASEVALLQQLKHPNVIALIGTCAEPVAIVTEYCHKGNLFVVLNDTNQYPTLTYARKLSIARGLANGMAYLHTRDPPLIHRDLKSLNVLLTRDWVVKITDFGLSKFKPASITDIMTQQCGTYHWMAPEVINSTRYSEKADVYSFAVILWEILCRAIPYDGMQPVQVVAAVINRQERPRLPATCPPDYGALVRSCWAHDPDDRPPFTDIMEVLRTMPG